jgi:hypothetical protein
MANALNTQAIRSITGMLLEPIAEGRNKGTAHPTP